MARGELPAEDAVRRLVRLPFEDLGFARVDHHRALRALGPEVVYARGKTPEETAAIVTALLGQGGAAESFGCRVDRLLDVGVAGAHRLFADIERLQAAGVLVVVAGMEGALPSLVAGLVGAPVIAVPTSVGYGAAFEGLAALLGMLNSCAVGVAVVNIDNGFGAGALAARILAGRVVDRRAAAREREGAP